MRNIPKEFVKSKFRKEMWKNASDIIESLEKVLPVKSIHVVGSFATAKKRPADVDLAIVLKTGSKKGNKNKKWSVDMVIIPDNKYGRKVFKDARDWVFEKYGKKKASIVRLK